MVETDAQIDTRGNLLSSVSHDLREPLASMTMGIGFLRKLLPEENEAALRVVQSLQRAVARMEQRVSMFSDLGRLEARALTLDIGLHEIAPILEAAGEQWRTDAAARPLTLSLEVGADVATRRLRCDRRRLLQILSNLCACTLRVASDGASASIRASGEAGGSVRFEVAATRSVEGRPFTAPLPQPELTIARGLVDLHGGLWAAARDSGSLALSFTIQGATPT
jgi:signal transduction histidine kinase